MGLDYLCSPNWYVQRNPPIWGRSIYSFEFEGASAPAIIIEATPNWETYHYPKKQPVDEALEFELLKKDGMRFREPKREFWVSGWAKAERVTRQARRAI